MLLEAAIIVAPSILLRLTPLPVVVDVPQIGTVLVASNPVGDILSSTLNGAFMVSVPEAVPISDGNAKFTLQKTLSAILVYLPVAVTALGKLPV